MGASIPKQFMALGGIPILARTVRKFLSWNDKLKVTLVLPQVHFDTWEEIANQYLSPPLQARIQLCPGGKSRTESVSHGLRQLIDSLENPSETLVAIHDGVRPFIASQIIHHAFQDASAHGASVVCVPVKASLRKKTSDSESKAVDRAPFFEVQTPQTFNLAEIYEAYQQLPEGMNFTDDASLYEWKGGQVKIIEGSYDNIKITTPEDIFVGEKILASNVEYQ